MHVLPHAGHCSFTNTWFFSQNMHLALTLFLPLGLGFFLNLVWSSGFLLRLVTAWMGLLAWHSSFWVFLVVSTVRAMSITSFNDVVRLSSILACAVLFPIPWIILFRIMVLSTWLVLFPLNVFACLCKSTKHGYIIIYGLARTLISVVEIKLFHNLVNLTDAIFINPLYNFINSIFRF